MKLTSPHFSTIDGPSLAEVAASIDALTELVHKDAGARDRFLILDADDGSGAFMQAIAVDSLPHWLIEVSNGDEAALRALRQPTTRGPAVELLGRFLGGERSLGNGVDWLDVDRAASRQKMRTPTSFALVLWVIVIAVWWFFRS